MNAGIDVNHGTAFDRRAVGGSPLYDGVESSGNGNNSEVSSNQVRSPQMLRSNPHCKKASSDHTLV